GAPVSTDTELGQHMIAFETRVRQDTYEIYTRMLLAGQLNMLFRDRRAHAYTRHLMETEARLSREAWRRHAVTSEMLKANHRRFAEMRELRTADRDHTTGTGDHTTGTGDSTTGTGYRTTGTTRTRWRSCTARAARGGW
ncbi:hypothetical protein Tco_0258551, partial [Tanacetum coccineum]